MFDTCFPFHILKNHGSTVILAYSPGKSTKSSKKMGNSPGLTIYQSAPVLTLFMSMSFPKFP